MNARTNIWELDAVKGAAMLAVLLIHGEPLVGSYIHTHLINRAVPVLLVLFGASSELWWLRRSAQPPLLTAREFWSARLRRLLPPVWAALLIWWVVKLYVVPGPVPRWSWIPAHVLGYIPQVGTGWFVTLILQLVLLFPLLRVVSDRVGLAVCAAVSLAGLIWCHLNALDVVHWMRVLLVDSAPVAGFFVFYYLWIFAPARFFSLLAGIWLARRSLRLPLVWSAAALACVLIGAWVQERLLESSYARNALAAVLDVPLTIGLLGLMRLARPAALRGGLCWLGRESWGIYLGQLIVHSTLHERLNPGDSPGLRWLYCGLLLAAGVAWVYAARGLALLRLPRSTPPPTPALAASERSALIGLREHPRPADKG